MVFAALARFLALTVAVFVSVGVDAADTLDAAAGSPTAQQRYEQARQLMQQGRYADAARAFRNVAESDDAAAALQAQSLFVSGLMLENARDYEQAVKTYHEVESRFPGTVFAKRATDAVKALEEAGGERWIEFRRRQDAALDELVPAQSVVQRQGLRAARPGLERAAAQFEAILRDFGDSPRAKDTALALGNTYSLLQRFGDARADYERAIALARQQSQEVTGGGREIDNFLIDVEARLIETIRAARRQVITRVAYTVLAVIGLGLLPLRPWRAADEATLRLAASFTLATGVLAVVAMGASFQLLNDPEAHSPIDTGAAGLLVAMPGLTGEIVALSVAGGLRATFKRGGKWPTALAAGVGALAALAVATGLVNAFALFPYLDSEL